MVFLRKDPTDLPKFEYQNVILSFVAYDSKEIASEEVVFANGKFVDRDDYEEIPYFNENGVLVAWCELPQFKE